MKRKSYGTLTYDAINQSWVIDKLAPHVAMKLKQIFTKLSPSSICPFVFKNTDTHAADLAWFMERYPLECSTSDRRLLSKRAKAFYLDQEASELILSPTWIPKNRAGLLEGQILRHYQQVAIDMVEKMRSLILLDDVGLGKTYEGLAVALIEGSLPLVIVCQPHLQKQWVEKAKSFINLRVHAPNGNKPYDLEEADIYIFKYNQLSPWIDTLTQGWVKAVVFDEIQELRRGDESAKGQAAENLCRAVDRVNGCLVGLTATLIYNYGIEAFNIINMLRPGLLGSRQQFLQEYCDVGSQKGIVKFPDELGSFLQESLMVLRRTKADVGQEAKQIKPELEWVEPDEHGLKEAEELTKALALTTLSGSFTESGAAARELDMRLREMTGIAKARATAAFVRMFVESGQPVLLFGWHREVYEIWAKELRGLRVAMYTGSESPKQKEQAKKDFINGEVDVLIMSLRSGAGADGLQFRGSTIVFGELDFSPLVHRQCIGRLDRDGQESPVYTYYVVANYGSDPVLIDTLGLKQSQSDGIQDPGAEQAIAQADPDRIKRMARAYLESIGEEIPMPAVEPGQHIKKEAQLELI